ncbi:MAG: hypothetical protein LBN02_05765 [Oscillospiraceae bacterium]|jgi:hypothetical protein|nr:hypothetical protein [Oscillospiraceae bacterium]
MKRIALWVSVCVVFIALLGACSARQSATATRKDTFDALTERVKTLSEINYAETGHDGWERDFLADLKLPEYLTYDEFMSFFASTDLGPALFEDNAVLTRAEYDELSYDTPHINLAYKGIRADINGDGTPEIVLVTRTGGGSEGGRVCVYEKSGDGYKPLLWFYIGMQGRAYIVERDGFLFVAIGNGTSSSDAAHDVVRYERGADILSFDADWTDTRVLVYQGKVSVSSVGENDDLFRAVQWYEN